MRDYRIYFIDEQNRVFSPPAIAQCEDDEQAVEHAKQLLNGQPLEIWTAADGSEA
jgi:hypothetical protein